MHGPSSPPSVRRWRSATRATCTTSSPATTARPRRRSAASSSTGCPTPPSSARRTGRRQRPLAWYVDPIDGTANFARGLASWCVSVGAVIGDEIVAGAIVDPVGGNVFSADRTGAWLNGAPLRSRAVEDERRAALITGYPVARDFRLDGRERALASFGALVETFSTLRRPGSAALSIAHVAAGWADAACGFGVNPWDVTAAILILRQAGGTYRPLTQGKVPPGAPAHLCPGYVATGAGAAYPTLDRVADDISAGRIAALSPLPSAATIP